MFKKLLLIALTIFFVFTTDSMAEVCKYWQAEVDPDIEVEFEIDETKSKNIMKGIECLLSLEGNKQEGLFGGATNESVSQIFPKSTIEICALYYISYLFYQDWNHASAVALVGSDGSLNSDETVKRAFERYRLWFTKIKKVGLQKARSQRIDPLEGSGMRWY